MSGLPILYSFRRCPYAIRARLAIKASQISVELREVVLADKPNELLACSSKGTVPVLVLPTGEVIDESLDIMLWALTQHDSHNLLVQAGTQSEMNHLIEMNDGEFKQNLDHYKYSDRFPVQSKQAYRHQGEKFLLCLERKLNQNQYLLANEVTLTDMAILPFIRQFSLVDKTWFYQSEYKKLQAWLDTLMTDALFNEVMIKYVRWKPGDEVQIF